MKLTKASRNLVGKHLRVLKAFGKFKNGDIVRCHGVWRNNVQVSKANQFGSRDWSIHVHINRFELAEPSVTPVKLPTGETWVRGLVTINPIHGEAFVGGTSMAKALLPFDFQMVTVTIKRGL